MKKIIEKALAEINDKGKAKKGTKEKK